jgi:hypothetical protein
LAHEMADWHGCSRRFPPSGRHFSRHR